MDTTYSFTRQQLRNVIRESIKMYEEFKDQYGFTKENAIHSTIRETLEGLDVENELVHSGELEPKYASQIL